MEVFTCERRVSLLLKFSRELYFFLTGNRRFFCGCDSVLLGDLAPDSTVCSLVVRGSCVKSVEAT